MLPALNYKRIILAVLIVVISLGLIFGVVWLIFIRNGTELGERPTGTGEYTGGLPGTETGPGGTLVGPTGNTLPGAGDVIQPGSGDTTVTGGGVAIAEVAEGSFTKVNSLSEDRMIEVEKDVDGFNYLSAEDNKFYRVAGRGGEKLSLSTEEFPFVDKVTWSPDGQKVILQYPDGATISYDFTTNKKVTLPTGTEDPSFDQNSDNIAYKYVGANEEDNWLVVSDINNNKATAIEPIGDKGDQVQVTWSPNNQVIALYRESIGLESEEIIFIGLNDENFQSLKVAGSNFSGIWSPSGDKILYHVISSSSNYNPVLWVTDAAGDNIGNNNFNLGLMTWSDKCTFGHDGRTVYCAVPVSLPEASGMYPDLLNDQPDVFYQINLTTGVSKMIAYPVLSENLEKFQAKKLFISDDDSKLYFWDNLSSKLYYVRLR
ncbi:MAG TPA: hypothetical protein P5267_02390 [Patescibacteria group bacterium]|nr:hypothetical protein [Patescibacteria group bacterium]